MVLDNCFEGVIHLGCNPRTFIKSDRNALPFVVVPALVGRKCRIVADPCCFHIGFYSILGDPIYGNTSSGRRDNEVSHTSGCCMVMK